MSSAIYNTYMVRCTGQGTWSNGKYSTESDEGSYIYVRAWGIVRSNSTGTVSLTIMQMFKGETEIYNATYSPSATQTTSKSTSATPFYWDAGWLISIQGGFDVDERYSVSISLNSPGGSSSAVAYVAAAFRTIDVLAGGHGIAFGTKATKDDTLEVANMNVEVDGEVKTDRGHFRIGSTAGRDSEGELDLYLDASDTLFFLVNEHDDLMGLQPLHRVYLSALGNLAFQPYTLGNWGTVDYFLKRSELNAFFSYETVTSSNIGSVAANGGTAWVGSNDTWSVSKTGYKAIAISGYYINGAPALSVYCMRFTDATHIQFAVRNNSSTATSSTAKIEAQILYVRDY